MDTPVLGASLPSSTALAPWRTAARAAARAAVGAGLGLTVPDPLAPLLLGVALAATAAVDRLALAAALEGGVGLGRAALASVAASGTLLAAVLLRCELKLPAGAPNVQTTALAAALDRLAGQPADALGAWALRWLLTAFVLGAPFGLRLLADDLIIRGSTPARLRRNGAWFERSFVAAGLAAALAAALLPTPPGPDGWIFAVANVVFFALVGAVGYFVATLALIFGDGAAALLVQAARDRAWPDGPTLRRWVTKGEDFAPPAPSPAPPASEPPAVESSREARVREPG